jgi:peptide/nickel transport system permease protein
MGRYLLERAGVGVLIVVLAVTLLFGMIHLVPGDPVSIMLGPRASPELRQALLRLDQPFVVQLFRFYGDVLTGDLGLDVFSNRSVATIVLEVLPYTLSLIFVALGCAAAAGIPLGCYAAVRPNTVTDRLTALLSVSFIAVPSFVVALGAQIFFAARLQWLPAIGAGETGDLADQLKHLILPAFALGLGWVGYFARLVRASMIEVLKENHVRTARSFGLPERWIVFRYALRVAILPTVTILGVGIGSLLSGAVFVEILFARPGIGKLVFDSVTTRNYPVAMGAVLITTVIFVISTTLSDVVNAFLDPRVRASL